MTRLFKHSDFANARMNMDTFNPENPDEADYKFLRLSDLDIIENGPVSLSDNIL